MNMELVHLLSRLKTEMLSNLFNPITTTGRTVYYELKVLYAMHVADLTLGGELECSTSGAPQSTASRITAAIRSASRHLANGALASLHAVQPAASNLTPAGCRVTFANSSGQSGRVSGSWGPQDELLLIRAACLQYPLQTCSLQSDVLRPSSSFLKQIASDSFHMRSGYGFGPRSKLVLLASCSLEQSHRSIHLPTDSASGGGGGRQVKQGGQFLTPWRPPPRSVTHSSELEFLDFVEVFRSFNRHMRKDLKDLFDQVCQRSPPTAKRPADGELSHSSCVSPAVAPSTCPIFAPSESCAEASGRFRAGLITRNSPFDQDFKARKICDAIAIASITGNSVATGQSKLLTCFELQYFLKRFQREGVIYMYCRNIALRKCYFFDILCEIVVRLNSIL